MKRHLALWIGWISTGLLAGPAAGAPAKPQPPAVLRWNNGESLFGEIMEASSSDVTWKTPLFEDPLQLRWSDLRRIDQPLAAVPVGDPFGIELRDGSHIYGSIVSVTETSLSIHGARHGDVSITRSEVLSARRLRGGNLLLAGPEGDVGWEVMANGNRIVNVRRNAAPPSEIPILTIGAGGSLSMPYWNRSAFLSLALPERVDLEFRVRSSARPDFRLELENDPKLRLETERGSKGRLSVETWDDDLVFTTGEQFKLIRKISDKEREVSLRICWDAKVRKCSAFTPAGELLAEWENPGVTASPGPGANTAVRGAGVPGGASVIASRQQVANNRGSGLTLQNKGRDLAMDFLRVRAWDGTPPPKVNVKQARVELDDGRILEGTVRTGSADSIQFLGVGEDVEETIPLSDIDAMVFPPAEPQVIEREATLSYADGTLLVGKIASVKDGAAAVLTAFTQTPLASRMDGLRQLRLRVPPPANAGPQPRIADLDKITIGQITLHGTLTSGGDNWPRWLPVGGVRPAMPVKGLASEIKRAFPPDAKILDAPALFYTSGGDVLPGILRGIDRSGVEFESGLVEASKLPADAIDAIQLRPAARPRLQGFNDPGWQVLKGNNETVHRVNGVLEMAPGTALGHPSLMQCSEMSFTVDSTNFSSFRLRLFCEGVDGTKSKNLLILRTGYQFFSSMESAEGQFANQIQTRVSSSSPVSMRLVINDQSVELHVDGAMIQKFPIPAPERAGSGLIIEPASVWGNMINPVTLSQISVITEPGRTWLPGIAEETKKQALTVPRFRKDDPPRHALLAPNGDVLRGEIEASTGSHFGFRAGLENLRVPIDRVRAVIWLKKPVEDGAAPAAVSPTLKRLNQKISRFVAFEQSTLSVQIAFLKREAPDLVFKLPQQRDSRAFPMQFGNKTIGEALDQICLMFGLRRRIDGEGAIVLEFAPPAQEVLAQKVYWLKPDAFPGAALAQEVLAGKGIPFPPGSVASWQARGGQLLMTNTPANHEKLAKLLQTDFGGSLGSPTHWLLLTNGARLGLVVDAFDKDSISGHHPVYGRCKAPMSEIYAISTSMPEPAAAANPLKDWRLVFAPEPVLPEAGGDSSQAVGKVAGIFKLPLLGGGDFDLDKEKGKVVVLDFWATWCGPCVQSLPGLIEAMSAFPADRVKFIGVNQSEPAEQVKRFLETRGWKLTVAMDASQTVAHQYGVDGIPHTVIVGPDGKVAWVKTGYSPGGDAEAANAVKQLLAPAPDIPVKAPAP
jgi:thiol-disulfide isomerase/thioredoxin